MVLVQFEVVFHCFYWFRLVWIGFEEFLCKGNDEVLKESLSKNFKTHIFVLAIN